MHKYVAEVIAAWENVSPMIDSDGYIVVKSKKSTEAAPEHLFKVNEAATKLDGTKAAAFHNIVAKVLNLLKWLRPNILVAIAFLTTLVRETDVEDWKKLGHMVDYLCSSKDLPLLLGADKTGIIKWYVDASFAVHPNMRGHTESVMTLGWGAPVVASSKQKMNTHSST